MLELAGFREVDVDYTDELPTLDHLPGLRGATLIVGPATETPSSGPAWIRTPLQIGFSYAGGSTGGSTV